MNETTPMKRPPFFFFLPTLFDFCPDLSVPATIDEEARGEEERGRERQ
jgi:hypothetical protein